MAKNIIVIVSNFVNNNFSDKKTSSAYLENYKKLVLFLNENHILEYEELGDARKVITAAALTYVAALAVDKQIEITNKDNTNTSIFL